MAKVRQLATRQRIRKALLFLSLLLFPITLYYFSPAMILQGAAEGIITGSFIAFGLMFLSALFLGRLWCGWACPAGALQEFGSPINNRPVRRKRLDWIKWVIWAPWIGLIAVMAIQAGGFRSVDPFFQIEGGLTLLQQDPPWFIVYYIIIALFLGLAVIFGRRAGCHTVCWMAPFMILGRKIRNLFSWPSLRLKPDEDACIDCGRCTRECPMSLDVNGMVHAATMENDECILCGSCVDVCPKDVIHYSFSSGK
ncbi:MAG: 4Fe-4S binding protein [Anaerolineae bacterium]